MNSKIIYNPISLKSVSYSSFYDFILIRGASSYLKHPLKIRSRQEPQGLLVPGSILSSLLSFLPTIRFEKTFLKKIKCIHPAASHDLE